VREQRHGTTSLTSHTSAHSGVPTCVSYEEEDTCMSYEEEDT
jgi:hypothetical protein